MHQTKNKQDAMKTDCPEKFSDISYKDSCYHFEREGGNILFWDGADATCRINNGTLAAFETREEWDKVGKSLVTMGGGWGWIGGKVIMNGSNNFQWRDGTIIETGINKRFGWFEGEPEIRDDFNCVGTGTGSETGKFGWYTDDCRRMKPFLCEFNRTVSERSSSANHN
jgi:hypothetical protein